MVEFDLTSRLVGWILTTRSDRVGLGEVGVGLLG